jgi:aminoglycoside 3-N-acetyltransferase I
MQSIVQIQRLTRDDTVLLRQLNTMFAVAFEDAEAYSGAPPSEAYCREVLGKEQVIVLVASSEAAVLGGLVAYELHKLERARSEVYIYDLAVDRSHRRHGIATRLIEQLGVIARERGAWAMFVQADYGDEPAISLYDKLGVREEVLHFDLPLA